MFDVGYFVCLIGELARFLCIGYMVRNIKEFAMACVKHVMCVWTITVAAGFSRPRGSFAVKVKGGTIYVGPTCFPILSPPTVLLVYSFIMYII